MTYATAATVPAIERTLELKAPPDRVWQAITDPSELARWFPQRAEWDLRPGGKGTFFWEGYGDYEIRVEAVDPPSYLAWRWSNLADVGLEADGETTLVEWWLEEGAGGGTTLRLRESGFTRPGHREGNEEGWTDELEELQALLDSSPN